MKTIKVYTDGACSGNPGKAGIGVVIIYQDNTIEKISQYIGDNQTNNIAELTAILVALRTIKDKTCKVIIHSDSLYSINVLTGKSNANKNRDLIKIINLQLNNFKSPVEFVKVPAHSNDKYNNIADNLAVTAIKTSKTIKDYI
ncbi:MAG: ribonuclease HI [Melioribacteraceae bacterium]|nr:ribonuclease HI [Candidatus Pacearchaeota archaeon]MCF8356671.1 ribonuclease HI [Melioribacteraceae bacterium]